MIESSSHHRRYCIYPAHTLRDSQSPYLKEFRGRRTSCFTVALATSQVSPPFSHGFPPYPGPWSFATLDKFYFPSSPKSPQSVHSFLSKLQIDHLQDRWQWERADCLCKGGRGELHSRDQNLMSQRLGSSRPNRNATQTGDVKEARPPASTHNILNQQSPDRKAPPRHGSDSSAECSYKASPRPSGPSGMQKLLNPTAQDTDTNSTRRRSIDQLDDSASSKSMTPQLPEPVSRVNPSLPSITPPLGSAHPGLSTQVGRRTLTPRTTSSSSYGALPTTMGLPSGQFDAKASPFMPSRDSADAMSFAPSFPPVATTLPTTSQMTPLTTGSPTCNPVNTIPQHQLYGRERQTSSGATSSQRPASQSNSPSTSYSSYSRFSRTPPPPPAAGATQPSSFFSQPFGDHEMGSTCIKRLHKDICRTQSDKAITR